MLTKIETCAIVLFMDIREHFERLTEQGYTDKEAYVLAVEEWASETDRIYDKLREQELYDENV